jgi:methylase of polypeptide subunit release factors
MLQLIVIDASSGQSRAPALTRRIEAWLDALEKRHLANLRFAEVTRALRALSSAYVERRREGAPRGALDSAGKRAAFALFYAPLHFIAVGSVVEALAAQSPAPRRILDVGCGTGVAGAAWAIAATPAPAVLGIDRHAWAAAEARWTYRQLGLRGHAQSGELPAHPRLAPGDSLIAA